MFRRNLFRSTRLRQKKWLEPSSRIEIASVKTGSKRKTDGVYVFLTERIQSTPHMISIPIIIQNRTASIWTALEASSSSISHQQEIQRQTLLKAKFQEPKWARATAYFEKRHMPTWKQPFNKQSTTIESIRAGERRRLQSPLTFFSLHQNDRQRFGGSDGN